MPPKSSPKRQSAGLLLFRRREGDLEVLLGHPGGPFLQRKDDGAWSIPKGLVSAGEALLSAARREFVAETGHDPRGTFIHLGVPFLGISPVRYRDIFQKSRRKDGDGAAIRYLTDPPSAGRSLATQRTDGAGEDVVQLGLAGRHSGFVGDPQIV
jgi:8-oxo-dGTP pyrophosphatase MutT (NUDIX family)